MPRIKTVLAASAVATLGFAAAAPAQADACVLTPLSPCGIVGSKIPLVKQIVEDTLPPAPPARRSSPNDEGPAAAGPSKG